MDESRELLRFARRNPVVVHDMERVSRLPHVQARQSAPRSADGVERPVFAVAQHVEAFKGLLDKLFRLFQRFARDVLQRKTSERKRHAIAHA